MSKLQLQVEYVHSSCSYGESSYHPRTTYVPVWEDNRQPKTIYPTEGQCYRFALRVQRIIRSVNQYIDLSRIILRIDLEDGSKYITHTYAYPGATNGDDPLYEANRRYIANNYAETGIIKGGIAYMPLNMETIKEICDLDGYPLFDDELLSEVELEWEDEAWREWVRADISRAIGKATEDAISGGYTDEDDPTRDEWDDLPDGVAYQFYRDAMEATNTYFESNYVDVDRIVGHIIEALIADAELVSANIESCGVLA